MFEHMTWEAYSEPEGHWHYCPCGKEVWHEPDNYYASRPNECREDNRIYCQNCEEEQEWK